MTSRIFPVVAVVLLAALSVCGQVPPAGPASAPATGSGLIAGCVLDAKSGSPVAGVVVAMSTSGLTASPSSPRVLTDAGGRFSFSDLAPGSYNLTATKPGWVSGSFGRRRPAGNVLQLVCPPYRHAG